LQQFLSLFRWDEAAAEGERHWCLRNLATAYAALGR
jgi:hypothetical protein